MLKASVIGNLGSDPELRYSASGQPTLRMNIASNYRARNPEGEWQDTTEWVRVTVFGQRAESLAQHLKKGSRVYVEGRLEARPWTDRAGNVQAGLEVTALDVEFVSSRQDRDDGDPGYSHPPQGRTVNRGRPVPDSTAVHAGQPRRGGTAVADRGHGDDLEGLPF